MLLRWYGAEILVNKKIKKLSPRFRGVVCELLPEPYIYTYPFGGERTIKW